jgi:hypothetical protein
VHTDKIKNMDKVPAQFGEALNCAGLLWGVGASSMLYRHGIVNIPNDIDILVAEKDIKEAESILSRLGQKQEQKHSSIYATGYFYEYTISGVDVDVMSGYKIKLPKGTYSYIFDKESIPDAFCIEGIDIPFTTPEDWYVLYQLMPGREEKAKLVEDLLKTKGIKYPALLQRMITQENTPTHISERVIRLFK